MSIQTIIEFLNSNSFLVISYALIFIMLSGFALRFIAKLLMFFVYIVVFAMSFMISSTPGFDTKQISLDKIGQNISISFSDLNKMATSSRDAVNDIYKSVDTKKITSGVTNTQNQLNDLSKRIKQNPDMSLPFYQNNK